MKSISGNSILMKEINTNILRRALKQEQKTTKQRLSELTGLSIVTVGSILEQLLETNEAYVDELVPSKGGRPALRVCYNSEYSYVLVLYAHENQGSDTIFIRVSNLLGQCVYNEESVLENIFLNSFEPIINRLLEKYPNIKAIGFGLPGEECNEIMAFNDYENLTGTHFTEHYRKLYGLPVAFENDVNAAIVGYCHTHGIESDSAIIYIYFPNSYPPGAGIFINGKLYKGFNNFAGEIKNIPIGINWENVDYQCEDTVCDIISKVIAAITFMLNPEQVILYGSFLTQTHLDNITHSMKQSLLEIYMPKIYLSQDFNKDFEQGAIKYTLDLLEHKLVLSK